jgi:hypothetical protein
MSREIANGNEKICQIQNENLLLKVPHESFRETADRWPDIFAPIMPTPSK